MSEEHYIAYHGFAYLKNATDSHKTGLQIQLRLDHEQDYKVFKAFKKHRKGKAGTGLYRAFTRVADKHPAGDKEYTGWYGPVDLKFLRWTVSSANGAVVTFEMEDYDEWRKMRDVPAIDDGSAKWELRKTELMLVELDQEGVPINVKQRAKLEQMELKRKWPKGGAQSKRAARLCQDHEFVRWACEKMGVNGNGITPADIAEWMRQEADIDSRAQLDHDDAALQRFEERVMKPFLRYTMSA